MSVRLQSVFIAAALLALSAAGARAQSGEIQKLEAACEGAGDPTAHDREGACDILLRQSGLSPHQEAMIHTNRGWARSEQHEMLEAGADYDRAVELDPQSHVAWNERGLFNLRQGRLDAALTDYDAALKLAPDAAFEHYGRGLTLIRKGQTADGQAELATARRYRPDVDEVFRKLGFEP